MEPKELIDNLESMVDLHQVLLEVLHMEKALPASCSLSELQEIHSVRDQAVYRIRELEAARLNLISVYQRRYGLERELTLKEIAYQCWPQYRNPLIRLRSRLNRLLAEIRQAGMTNAEKAVARIACFRELERSIDKSFHRHPLYSIDGMVNQSRSACLLNKSI